MSYTSALPENRRSVQHLSLRVISFSLSIEHGLEVGDDVVRGNLMLVELGRLAFSIDKVFGKVPLDFTFRKLLLEVLVDGVGAIALNVRLLKDRELSLVGLFHPSLDLIT